MIDDPGLAVAVENLRRGGPETGNDIRVVADCLGRNETNLLRLRRAGLPGEVVEACFLLSHRGDGLLPERLESVKANRFAKSGRIMELRSLLERRDSGKDADRAWEIARESFVRALDYLENGTPDALFQEEAFSRRPGFLLPEEQSADFDDETEG